MSYVDAFLDRDKDIIKVVERINGKREYREYPAKYTFYYADPRGKYTSVFGDKLTRVQVNTSKKFNTEKKIHQHKKLFESDVNPLFRCLADNYIDKDAPDLNLCFFDIEVDFNKDKGFADPSDPFNPITAIALHLGWMKKTICIAIKPETLTKEQAQEICNKFEDTFLMDTEEELLNTFLDLIDDADVLSGWNSEGFDIPYMVNRISRVLSKSHTRKFCLWERMPRERMLVKFGKESQAYELTGRVHLDYLELYRKFTYHEMHSYSLDAIGEYELSERKVAYDGTLDQLYNNDFETFISYNRQDVDLLVRLDKKLQFIDLANVLSHANTVPIISALGAVAQTDMAIVNEAHSRGFIVPDKNRGEKPLPAAGAYVATPDKGMHKWIGSVDLNSLYPSILRACNMSPETIVGQVRHSLTGPMIESFNNGRDGFVARAWEGKFATEEYELVMAKDVDQLLYVDFENGDTIEATGKEIYDLIFNSGETWLITANATIFRYDKQGIVPGLLERWYAERKELQTKAREAREKGGDEFEFWDKRQLVKKINLNSLYGAILNPGCRFFDKRIGQSTTLSGRQISKHMAAKINEVITGEYNHVGKAIIYGDTDSAYFSAYEVLKKEINDGSIPWTKESVIKLYDQVCEEVNGSFKKFMAEAFHCLKSRAEVIQAGRESVAETGLFITKKRYAILIYDLEGYRQDVEDKPGKIKAMGLDLKRSDTPLFIQDFLNELLLMVLTKKTEAEVLDRISQFRNEFKQRPGWEKGSPRRANNIQEYAKKEARLGKANMPGHVRASLNWNNLKKMHSDKYSMEIHDGMKVIVCKLKKNPLEYTSVAYPTDEMHIPVWFKELPFDNDAMESTLIDNKLGNLLGVLGWDIKSTESKNTFNNLFDFGG